MTTAPRLYRKPVSLFWWAQRRSYLIFVLRELSSVFVAWFVVYLLLLIHAVSSGNDEYQRFLSWSAGPWVVALNTIALLFVLLHAITWFDLAPKAMVVRVRGRRVAPVVVLGLHYVLWAVSTALVLWVVLR
ncbi:fumarate reductase subunit C [Nocardia amikacinitolerans]|uniref:fumarate reductase subunit C n=1 Tax=Nocardia amikacinitolerans TaxID=756689 RepID=UPI0020A2C9F0|nr:fumarate reductase subunit C [Nocardia amikacinitolerans]MCP2288855.1 fumarate reductase subunit C [Nocardia amikacinitolerans]